MERCVALVNYECGGDLKLVGWEVVSSWGLISNVI